jgi:hypothetical protein
MVVFATSNVWPLSVTIVGFAFDNLYKHKTIYIGVNQWFSTFGSWRPTKQNKTQFGDPNCTRIVQNTGFDDPQESARDLPFYAFGIFVRKNCT